MIHENDAARMKEFGDLLRKMFGDNLAAKASARASEITDESHAADNILDGNRNTFWCPREGTEKAVIEIDLLEQRTFNRLCSWNI